MPIANCANCNRRFRANEVTGDTCRFCRADQREADREAGAVMRMSVAVFGTNDPDELSGAAARSAQWQEFCDSIDEANKTLDYWLKQARTYSAS